MNSLSKKIWDRVGITGLITITLLGALLYMNLRAADPILPGWEEYDADRFTELMVRGEPVLVEIYAPWCPTCLLQHQALRQLYKEEGFPKIRAIRVDFDRDAAFRAKYGFTSTGLLVVFQGNQQIARASGLVSQEKIAKFINSLPEG